MNVKQELEINRLRMGEKLSQLSLAAIDRRLIEDSTGCLVWEQTPHHNALREDIEQLQDEHYRLTFNSLDDKSKTVVIADFESKLEPYINHLIENQTDLALQQEIKELLIDFPHLAERFE